MERSNLLPHIDVNRRHLVRSAFSASMVLAAGGTARARSTVPQTASGTATQPLPTVRHQYKSVSVATADGLHLAAQIWGNPDGKEIVFVHGLNQCYLSWLAQLNSPLLDDYKVVTYDLRGHGQSSKPEKSTFYNDGMRWGEDLADVIKATGLKRPVLVGWSLGGLVIAHYLVGHGTAAVAGINFVDAVTKFAPNLLGEASLRLNPMLSNPDLLTRLNYTKQFLAACFAVPPSAKDFDLMLTYNSLTPVEMHQAFATFKTGDIDTALGKVDVPVLVTFGEQDRLLRLEMAQHTISATPGARLSLYPGVGHSPFFEAPERFDRELTALLRNV